MLLTRAKAYASLKFDSCLFLRSVFRHLAKFQHLPYRDTDLLAIAEVPWSMPGPHAPFRRTSSSDPKIQVCCLLLRRLSHLLVRRFWSAFRPLPSLPQASFRAGILRKFLQ